MRRYTTLNEVMAAFLTYAPPSMAGHYQLDTMRALLQLFDNPQDAVPVIHIAGTSGKTSTAYFIRGLLEAAGKRTGLTVSPHIVSFNERVQIGGSPLDEPQFVAYASDFMDRVTQSNLKPTYFELAIALAYWVFACEAVDYAVVETGLGGLYDGTNTVSRRDKVCVITDIGLDHTEILGDTLPAIAAQKAGIIQAGNQVFICPQASEIVEVFDHTAAAQQAWLSIAAPVAVPSLLPIFQARNWQVALAAFDYLKQRDGLSALTPVQYEAVALQTPPGRWEVYHRGDTTIILDGAHNPQKLCALYESLKVQGLSPAAVLANLTQAPGMKACQSAAAMTGFTTHLIIPEFDSGQDIKSRRSLPAAEFATYAQNAGMASIEVQPDAGQALAALLARPEKTLVITGSLYLVSTVRARLIACLA